MFIHLPTSSTPWALLRLLCGIFISQAKKNDDKNFTILKTHTFLCHISLASLLFSGGYFVVYALDAILISEHMMRQTKEFWPRKLRIIEASPVVSV